MKLAFIGGGTMAEAILQGVLDAKLASPDEITVGEPLADRCGYLSKQYGVQAIQNNLEVVQDTGLVILAVKPQHLGAVTSELRGLLGPGQSALSIVAGVKMATLALGLEHGNIIRVMPNTPAQIGCGMSLWTCSSQVEKTTYDLTRSILSTIGQEIYVDDEKYLDMATALSASGPAYVFLVIEALIDAGVNVGLPRDMARTLALQTIYGSTKLAMETGKHPGELKDMVVSPGGTTAQGLQVLERAAVPAAFVEAVKAAYQKAIELGED